MPVLRGDIARPVTGHNERTGARPLSRACCLGSNGVPLLERMSSSRLAGEGHVIFVGCDMLCAMCVRRAPNRVDERLSGESSVLNAHGLEDATFTYVHQRAVYEWACDDRTTRWPGLFSFRQIAQTGLCKSTGPLGVFGCATRARTQSSLT